MSIKTTAGGENAVFIDNISQLEPSETEDACVAFSAANIFYSTMPGTPNHSTAEDVDVLADRWYTHFTGSIDSSAGLSEGQLQAMFTAMGLHWETIPVTANGPANDEAVRAALRAGKLVAICAAESSFFDLEIGRPPYSWNTQPFNHCIVASGLITSGPYKNNVWVRDTVAVSGGYPPSTKRPYDLGKMQYVSLTAVSPTWLKGETSDMIDITNPWVAAHFKQTSTNPNRWHCASTNQDLQAGILLGWCQMNGAPRLPTGPETKCGKSSVYEECEAGIVVYDPDKELDAPAGPWAPCYLLKLDSPLAKKLLGTSITVPVDIPAIVAALKTLQAYNDTAIQAALKVLGAQ